MAQLKTQIAVMSKAQDGSVNLEDLAQAFSSGLKSLNPVTWLHWIVVVAVAAGVIFLFLLILPIIFKLVFSSISAAKRDIHELKLKNIKGGDITRIS